MTRTVRLSDEFFRKTMQTAPVRAALAAKRDVIAREVDGQELVSSRGRRLGPLSGLQRSEGTRPAGRPYARLAAPVVNDDGVRIDGLARQALAEAAARHSSQKGDRRAG